MPRLRLRPDGPLATGFRSWCTVGVWRSGEVRSVSAEVAEYLLAKDDAFELLTLASGSSAFVASGSSGRIPDTHTGGVVTDVHTGGPVRDLVARIRAGDLDDRLDLDDSRVTVQRALARRRRVIDTTGG